MRSTLREGDTLIVWRLDRLGRSLGDLIRLTHDLKARGVRFASLTEQIDTRSPSGQLVFHVFGALPGYRRMGRSCNRAIIDDGILSVL
jgi:DNA invertase Pin-like site-specific DNA recombinase